tara:strand:+ start:606 stop:773 length:168 start_codon:yes stop_codon:yes gene_type:complete
MPKIQISQEMMMAAAAHAAERGMSLEEYVQEFVDKLQQQEKEKHERKNNRNLGKD